MADMIDPPVKAGGKEFNDIVAALSHGYDSALLAMVLMRYAPLKTVAAVLLSHLEVLGPLLLTIDDPTLRREVMDCFTAEEWEEMMAKPWSAAKKAQLLLAINPISNSYAARPIVNTLATTEPAGVVQLLNTLDPKSAAEVLIAAEYPRLAEAADLMVLPRLAALATAAEEVRHPSARQVAAVLKKSAKRFGVDLR